MSTPANILSFDEVRSRGSRNASTRRDSSARSGQARASRSARTRTTSSRENASYSRASRGADAAPSRARTARSREADVHSIRSRYAAATDAREALGSSRSSSRRTPSWYDQTPAAPSANDYGPTRSYTRSSQDSGQARSAVYTAEDAAREDSEENQSFASRMKRKFRGSKAEKTFAKRYGSEDDASSESSRAAFYEMKMGPSHKKASRMQDQSASRNDSKRGAFWGFLSTIASSQKKTHLFIVACALVFTCFMIYPPVADYYKEVRSVQQLEAEYAALQETNSYLLSEVNYLNTDEGKEDYARTELGWIRSDEHAVTVEGLEPSSSTSDYSSSKIVTSVPAGSVPAPSTWYSGVLDVVFGYKN